MNYYEYEDSVNESIRQAKMSQANLFSVDEGFAKGTIFKSIYEKYKDYDIKSITPVNTCASMMQDIQKYSSACHDLNLYLDIYPEDTKVLELYGNYNDKLMKAYNAYEAKYGPIIVGSKEFNKKKWNWIDSPFTWEEL